MQTLSEIRAILAERGLRPRHRLGQHFLHDKNQITRLVEAAALERGTLVLEVGPGTGTLTEALLDAGAEVVASEIDADLAAVVRDRFASRVHLVVGDCLAGGRLLAPLLVEALAGRDFTLVANLPYQVASPLMTTMLLHHRTCRGQFVTIQKEVADRLLATPGRKSYGALTVIVQALAEVRRIGTISPGCFWPPPDVDSAMVSIVPRVNHGIADPAALARFVTGLFSKRRKQLGTVFGRDRAWPAGVTADLRPEALTVEQIVELWRESDEATKRRSD